MKLDKQTRRYIIQIIAFAIIFFCALQNLSAIGSALRYILNLFLPFFLGGAIAFLFNVPMSAIEKHLFTKRKKLRKLKRPIAYLITLGMIAGIITLALFIIIPEIIDTIILLTDEIPGAFSNLHRNLQNLLEKEPYLQAIAGDANLNWDSLSEQIVTLLKTLSTSIINSGITLIKGIANGVVTFIIGFTFSIYVLFQKERLSSQLKRVFHALMPEKYANKTIYICKLSYKVFFQLSVRPVCGSGDPWNSFCGDNDYFPYALCNADRCSDWDYRTDSNLRCLHWLYCRNDTDRHCQSCAGNLVFDPFPCSAAD